MREFDFYIVPTPVGNLKDITSRAVEVLKSVDIIACEDMRVTQKLLNHYEIKTRCISYHKFNEKERVASFLEILKSGKKMALVSDAGTPLICDPGAVLLEELRKNNIKITALPGANAAITFLSQIPRESEDFLFAGFLPKTEAQIKKLILSNKNTDIVFYDSPKRLLKTLKIISLFRPNSRVSVGRELTKLFEEIIIDDINLVFSHFENSEIKGEIVGVIFREKTQNDNDDLDEKIALLKSKKFSDKDISVILCGLYGASKNDVYKKSLIFNNNKVLKINS